MAIVGAVLTGAVLADSSNTDPYTVPTATYTSGNYYLLFVTNTKATAADAVSSVTNSQVTFAALGAGTRTYSSSSTQLKRISVFGGQCAATGDDDTVIAFGASQTGCNAVVIEVTGHNATSTYVTNSFSTVVSDGVLSNVVVTITTPAVASSLNAIFAGFGQDTNGVMSPDNSFLELYDDGHGTPANRLQVSWLINGDDPGAHRAATADWGGVAVEINEASVGGAVTHAHSKIWGFSKLHGLVN